jgi:hypothetical protein
LKPGASADRTCSFYYYLELSLISLVKTIEKYLTFDARTWTKYHIYSQDKLSMLRCENRKICHENEIKKANE